MGKILRSSVKGTSRLFLALKNFALFMVDSIDEREKKGYTLKAKRMRV